MNRLPNDYCRCMGAGCSKKNSCLRHLDHGERSPWTERYCEPGEKYEAFIDSDKPGKK